MDSAFQDINAMFEAGAMLIAKVLFMTILLPEIAGVIVIGVVLRIRGELFRVLMIGVTLCCVFLFWRFGLPMLAEGSTKMVSP
ncbi:hypothetical protein ACFFSY_29575 [Paenibacillus aurantiacus]|uniref:Uncharacterized protein n=1 Tax=Paenibacillus aurantiacus TaxID=1936118 RepID=A0ABV5KY16_9BACL